MLKHKNIESFLPIFTGFYSTFFECQCEDSYIESPYTYDDYDFDYSEYKIRVAKACVDAIETKLNELGIDISVKFQSIYSPRYYNFSNDSINVKYKLTDDTINAINKYILKEYEFFEMYLKQNYTSRDGFHSNWSNDANVWLNEYLTDKKDLSHVFGATLDFILKNEGYDVEALYNDVHDETYYIDCALKEGRNTKDATDYAINYTRDNYMTKDAETLINDVLTTFEDNIYVTYDLIKKEVISAIKGIEDKTLNLFA